MYFKSCKKNVVPSKILKCCMKSRVDDRSVFTNLFYVKLIQNSYIYSTYTFLSRGTNLHATNGKGKMECLCQKTLPCRKKNQLLLLLRGLFTFMCTKNVVFAIALVYFEQEKTPYYILSSICRALMVDDCTLN